MNELVQKYKELEAEEKALKGSKGTNYFQEQAMAIAQEKTNIIEELNEITDLLENVEGVNPKNNPVLAFSKKLVDQFGFGFNSDDSKELIKGLKEQINKMKSEAEEAVKSIDINQFSIKDGKINVPIEIDVIQKQRDKTLEQSVLNTIQKLQEVIKSHPVLLDVKLKTNNNPYDKEGVKKKLLTQKDVKEYFDSVPEDVQTLDDKDFGKNFFNSFIESSKEAYNVAKVVIDKINESLKVAKISITVDEIQIDEEKIKGLSEQFNKIFDETQIDQFVEYFAESFSSLLGANDFEEALLRSLNNATDRWIQHFNESMNNAGSLMTGAFGEGISDIEKPDTTKLINDEIKERIERAKKYKERFDKSEGDSAGYYYVNMERELARLSILKKYATESNIDISQFTKQLENIKDLAYYNDLIQKGWKKYFNNTDDHSVKTDEYLKGVIPQETKEVDAKINLDTEAIAAWRQVFLDAIAEISVSLKSSLSSSAASSVDSWRNGMMDAVNDVAGQFASTMKATTDLSAMVGQGSQANDSFNEMYYVLSGWSKADTILNSERIGTSVVDLVAKSIENYAEQDGKPLTSKQKDGLKRLLSPIDYDREIYDTFNGTLERGGTYDLKTGNFINSFFFGNPHSMPGKLINYDYKSISDPSNIISFHSHPAKKNGKSLRSAIGADLAFSGLSGDFGFYKNQYSKGIKKNALVSQGKVHYLDFSQISYDQLSEIASRYDKLLKGINLKAHMGMYKGVNYGQDGVVDFEERNEKVIPGLAKIIKDVTGLDPSTIQHVFDVEEIKQNPKKFRDIGFLSDSAQISDTTELLETMAATIQKISDGDGFKIDTSSIDNLANSLQEILIILQRIHEESNIALSNFGANKKHAIDDVWQTFDDILQINDSSLKNGISQTSFRDLLLPVFKQYKEVMGKNGSAEDLFDTVLKDSIKYLYSK